MIGYLKHIFLVAAREYRTAAKTRSYRLTLLSVPLALIVMIGGQVLMQPPQGIAFMISDATGRYAPVIEKRIDADHQRAVMSELAHYVNRWHVEAYAPASLNDARRWFSDTDAQAFEAAGGAAPVVARLTPHLPKDAPAFSPPSENYYAVNVPANVDASSADTFARTVAPLLNSKMATSAGPRPLAAAIYIPKDFSWSNPGLRVWTGRNDNGLIDLTHDELTQTLRTEALTSAGLDAAKAQQVLNVEPVIAVSAPPAGQSQGDILVRSALPMALTYLLFISVMASGTKMLLGVVEERSNKLIESLLACMSPRQLMYGKLLAVVGLGLTTVAFWGGCAAVAAYGFHGQLVDVLKPALTSIGSPWIIAQVIAYFVCGFIMISMILLAVGSTSNSMQDAQGYLQPILMLIVIPYSLMMTSMIHDPNGLFPKVLSWIPVYTPFAMLARLGTGVQTFELVGTTALMLAFMAIELVWLGGVFEHNVLNTGQPSGLAAFFRKRPAG